MSESSNPHTNGFELDDLLEIEAALHSFPLDEPPVSLATGVMAQVRNAEAAFTAAKMPTFRLTWLDYALSLLVVILAGVFLAFTRLLPPGMDRYLRLELLYGLQRLSLQPVLPLLALGAIFLLAMGVIAAGILFLRLLPNGLKASEP